MLHDEITRQHIDTSLFLGFANRSGTHGFPDFDVTRRHIVFAVTISCVRATL